MLVSSSAAELGNPSTVGSTLWSCMEAREVSGLARSTIVQIRTRRTARGTLAWSRKGIQDASGSGARAYSQRGSRMTPNLKSRWTCTQ
eukprot:3092198-Amphidinium_carterae.1